MHNNTARARAHAGMHRLSIARALRSGLRDTAPQQTRWHAGRAAMTGATTTTTTTTRTGRRRGRRFLRLRALPCACAACASCRPTCRAVRPAHRTYHPNNHRGLRPLGAGLTLATFAPRLSPLPHLHRDVATLTTYPAAFSPLPTSVCYMGACAPGPPARSQWLNTMSPTHARSSLGTIGTARQGTRRRVLLHTYLT